MNILTDEEISMTLGFSEFTTESLRVALTSVARTVEAAVLDAAEKRAKTMEERRCEVCGYAEHHREHTGCLRTQFAESQDREAKLKQALENCRLLAARNRSETWGQHILRFCEEGGSTHNALRG